MPRVIKKQAPFDGQLENAVPDPTRRQEIETGLRFAVSEMPEAGIKTSRAEPYPVHVWRIFKTSLNPPLAIYYCFNEKMALLMQVRVLEKDPDDEESPR